MSRRWRAATAGTAATSSFSRCSLVQAGHAAGIGRAEDRGVFRQLLRADEAELVEELVIRRQAGEHLGHRRGDLAAGLDQVLGQPDLVEHGADVLIAGQRLEIENGADRRAEQQVFRDAGIRVVALRIEGLDQVGDPVGGEAVAQRAPRLEQPRGQLGVGAGIEPAAQAEIVDVGLEIEPGQQLDDAASTILRRSSTPAAS